MKKQLSNLTLGLAMLTSLAGFSQAGLKYPCYTDEATEQHLREDPEARKNYDAARVKLREDMQKSANVSGKTAATVYSVPIVFHVLHNGGPENISDAVIISALDWVNKDYARQNFDANTVAAPYSSLYINSDIKFILAKKDPSGNCTPGIVRHVDQPKMNWNQGLAQQTAYWSYTWDPTKYLNVYIVASIVPQGTVAGGGTIVGYTYIPGTWPTGNAHDAIVFAGGFLSTDARSLSHEIGHWLSLLHIWGSSNAPAVACGDDGIGDTPVTKGALFTCPSSLAGNPCAGTGGFDNVENIMNYCNCPKNFTTGQTNAMRTTLASGPSGRPNISSAINLVATDINGTGICAPIAEFLSTSGSYTVCSGASLTMKDFSYNGTVTAWSWTGTNGANISSPSLSITAVAFPSVGVSVITLSVTNAQGSSTKSRTVTVLDGTQGIPGNVYYESFEAVGTPSNWVVVNPNGPVQWDQAPFAGSNGSSSFYIEGLIDPANQIDYLQMPVIDVFDNFGAPEDTNFTFKLAYARYNATNNDKFEVQASINCGGTWQTILAFNAAQMAAFSGGINSNAYIPVASDWHKVNIANYPQWSNYQAYKSVTVRFMFQEGSAGNGNRIYLDEINIYPNLAVGVNELSKSIHFSLYPNPTNAESVIKFNLNDASNVKVNVTDVLGKDVLPAMDNNYSSGEQTISINKNGALGKGIYFINLSLNGAKMCKKLIIQ